MAITGASFSAGLDLVYRLETASARSWPSAQNVVIDNWLVRVDDAMASKRLNSINPMKPTDEADFDEKLSIAHEKFSQNARSVLFRMTPLAGKTLSDRLEREGWRPFETSHVMLAELDHPRQSNTTVTEVAPGQFSKSWAQARGLATSQAADIAQVLSRIDLQTGLFVIEAENGEAAATAICVCDGDLAGFFEVAVAEPYRRRGLARAIMSKGMAWARDQGASAAWLQVLTENTAATGLYRTLGFEQKYSYHYCKPPGGIHV